MCPRDVDKSERGSIGYEDAEEIHGRALKKSWKKGMKQDLKAVDKRVESLERRSGLTAQSAAVHASFVNFSSSTAASSGSATPR